VLEEYSERRKRRSDPPISFDTAQPSLRPLPLLQRPKLSPLWKGSDMINCSALRKKLIHVTRVHPCASSIVEYFVSRCSFSQALVSKLFERRVSEDFRVRTRCLPEGGRAGSDQRQTRFTKSRFAINKSYECRIYRAVQLFAVWHYPILWLGKILSLDLTLVTVHGIGGELVREGKKGSANADGLKVPNTPKGVLTLDCNPPVCI
jgi:hypothetical protein